MYISYCYIKLFLRDQLLNKVPFKYMTCV